MLSRFLFMLVALSQPLPDTVELSRAEPAIYNPVAVASISCDTFKSRLIKYNSPVAAESDEVCQTLVEEGIDPAVALAFFQHESTFGTAGAAIQTKNWGNIVCAGYPTCAGRWRQYASWREGARDWSKLMQNYKTRGLATLEQIIPVYAPASDGNATWEYINIAKQRIDAVRGMR